MGDVLLGCLDRIQAALWRIGVRFQWPCWLLGWAWDRQATPYLRVAAEDVTFPSDPSPAGGLNDWDW